MTRLKKDYRGTSLEHQEAILNEWEEYSRKLPAKLSMIENQTKFEFAPDIKTRPGSEQDNSLI